MFFLKTFYIVTPNAALPDTQHIPAVHMDYTVSQDGYLLRHKLAKNHRGGIMGVDVSAHTIDSNPSLIDAIISEYQDKQYESIYINGVMPQSVIDALSFPLYLSGKYKGNHITNVVDTALSGGSLEEYLTRLDSEKTALSVECACMDFLLPAKRGIGHALTPTEFRQKYEKYGNPSYFSPELCARYFTYFSDYQAHLVLFDDIQTIREKLSLANRLHFSAAFLPYGILKE